MVDFLPTSTSPDSPLQNHIFSRYVQPYSPRHPSSGIIATQAFLYDAIYDNLEMIFTNVKSQ